MLFDNENDSHQEQNLVETEGLSAVPPELEKERQSWLDRTGDYFGSNDDYLEHMNPELWTCTDLSLLCGRTYRSIRVKPQISNIS